MATTTQNEVKFNDGEGLVLSDLHDMQRFLKSMVFDQFVGASAKTDSFETGIPTALLAGYALTPSGGSGYAKPGGSARQVTNAAGMVYQWISTGAPTGTDCNLLGYQLEAGELLQTLAVGDATNPRIDGVFIKLSYDDSQDSQTRDYEDAVTRVVTSTSVFKKRRTVLAKTVVAGTPAANPVFPSTPAGYAVFCYVYVPSTHNAVFTQEHVWDERMPMRVGTIRTFPGTAIIGSNWAVDSSQINIANSGAGTMVWPCPLGPEVRVIGYACVGTAITNNIAIKKMAFPTNTITTTNISNGAAAGVAVSMPSGSSFPVTFLNGPLGTSTACPPIWGNGQPCGPYTDAVGGSFHRTMLLSEHVSNVTASTYIINYVEWIYAY